MILKAEDLSSAFLKIVVGEGVVMSEYRHEYKYLSSSSQMAIINNNISPLMELDKYAKHDGMYTVRSVYFDDYYNKYFYDNMYGREPREKFRIRIYNANSDRINLEIKQKVKGKVKKLSCKLNEELCKKILRGEILDINEVDSPVYKKFYYLYTTRLFRAKIIVEYDRIPYVYKDGNVRVTLDKNIRSSNQCCDFLEQDIFFKPIMETNQHLLEVKFDEYLPDFIKDAVENEKTKQTTFSKYFLCRKYGFGGGTNEL